MPSATAEPFKLSNSKANTFRRCPRRYQFSYVQKLERKRKAVQLYRGDWLHQLIMTHYDGEDWRKLQTKLTRQFTGLFDEEKEDLGDLPGETQRIFTNYLRHYQEEDIGWRIVDTELEYEIELPDGSMFTFIIDTLAEEADGGLWIWDHKTVKEFMPQDFMMMDSQLARYFYGARKAGIPPLRGVMFNELITKAPTLPKYLEASNRLEQRANIVCDPYTYESEVRRLGLDMKDHRKFIRYLSGQTERWFRRTRLPRDTEMVKRAMRELMMTGREMRIAERLGTFPRTTMKACEWDCDFREPCMIEYLGGDVSTILQMQYRTKEKRTKK